jgi:protein involved in ribonucleotide reduction
VPVWHTVSDCQKNIPDCICVKKMFLGKKCNFRWLYTFGTLGLEAHSAKVMNNIPQMSNKRKEEEIVHHSLNIWPFYI